jgi:hypothetical protein
MKGIQNFFKSPLFCFDGNCSKVCTTDSNFVGLSHSTRCGCCSYQVSSISVRRVTCYDHFCVFFNFLAFWPMVSDFNENWYLGVFWSEELVGALNSDIGIIWGLLCLHPNTIKPSYYYYSYYSTFRTIFSVTFLGDGLTKLYETL